jgi:hypothetical protein
MVYEHVQHGYLGLGTLALMAVVGAFSVPEAFADSALAGWAITATLLAITALVMWFSRLAVKVDQGMLSASFGTGRPRKVINLTHVATVSPVRNTWIQGWGIRKISGGWMYNVWGLDAIEFEMESGEIIRIGTDDTNGLLASVHVFTD